MYNFRIRIASLILGVRSTAAPDAAPSADMRRTWRTLRSDLGFMALLVGVLVALIVTTPATFLIVRPFHSDSPLLAVLAVALIGLAAVICKLMTLVLPEFRLWLDVLTIGLLAVEWFSNYAHGLDLFGGAELGSTFGAIRAAGYGNVAALIYASIPPVFLFAFLTMAVARARRLLYNIDALEMQRKLQPVREALQLAALVRTELAQLGMSDATVLALPDASAPHTCVKCGAPVASPQQRSASARWGCEACKN